MSHYEPLGGKEVLKITELLPWALSFLGPLDQSQGKEDRGRATPKRNSPNLITEPKASSVCVCVCV